MVKGGGRVWKEVEEKGGKKWREGEWVHKGRKDGCRRKERDGGKEKGWKGKEERGRGRIVEGKDRKGKVHGRRREVEKGMRRLPKEEGGGEEEEESRGGKKSQYLELVMTDPEKFPA